MQTEILPPVIDSIYDDIATSGGLLTIYGSSFDPPLTILLNNAKISARNISSTKIVCQVQPGTGAEHSIQVVRGSADCNKSVEATWAYL